jgi:hypothetical protein
MDVKFYILIVVVVKQSSVEQIGYLGDLSRGVHDRDLLGDPVHGAQRLVWLLSLDWRLVCFYWDLAVNYRLWGLELSSWLLLYGLLCRLLRSWLWRKRILSQMLSFLDHSSYSPLVVSPHDVLEVRRQVDHSSA